MILVLMRHGRDDMTKKIPRILITVIGGIVQDIACDSPVDIVLYDWDNIKDDPKNEWGKYPSAVMGTKAFDKLLAKESAEIERLREEHDG